MKLARFIPTHFDSPAPFTSALVVTLLLAAAPGRAGVVEVPPEWRVGPVQTTNGDGLVVRFKDVASGMDSIHKAVAATETVTVNVAVFPSINFLLNQGTTFGPWSHGGGQFAARYTGYLNVRVPGLYRLAFSADDGGEFRIADSVIVKRDGLNWNATVVSDSLDFAHAGLYPIRMIYYDGPPCCRGVRLGGLGPGGSGLLPLSDTYDFDADLGPCCIFGGGGPGNSVVPQALLYTSIPTTTAVGSLGGELRAGILLSRGALPNPFRVATMLRLVLGEDTRLWVDVVDLAGRRVAALAAGERFTRGPVYLLWQAPARFGGARCGLLFFRARTETGAEVSGKLIRLE